MNNNHNNHNNPCHPHLQPCKLVEGLESGDLIRLVSPRITIDEYKSKMGSDEDIAVLALHVLGKEPALDLVNFIEKSYEWVLDADVSSGEIGDGNFIVFVEIDREPELAEEIIELLEDLENLTEHAIDHWKLEYYKPHKTMEPTVESIKNTVPLTPEQYRNLKKDQKDDIDKLKTAAGVKVDTTAPKNDFTESLRVMAGIR